MAVNVPASFGINTAYVALPARRFLPAHPLEWIACLSGYE
jgi:hypothetical protein